MLDRISRSVRPEALTVGAWALVALMILAAYLHVLKAPFVQYRGLLRDRATASLGMRSEGEEPAALALAAVDEEVAKLRHRLYGGSSSVPLREMESYVIQTLDRISARHDVELMGVRPREPGRVLMFDELPYDVEVMGSYVDLCGWLQDMETELRPMVVNSYEFERKNSAEPVRMKLQLVAYRGREPKR